MSESLFSSIKETLINCVILENELNDLALKEEHLENARIIIDTAEKYKSQECIQMAEELLGMSIEGLKKVLNNPNVNKDYSTSRVSKMNAELGKKFREIATKLIKLIEEKHLDLNTKIKLPKGITENQSNPYCKLGEIIKMINTIAILSPVDDKNEDPDKFTPEINGKKIPLMRMSEYRAEYWSKLKETKSPREKQSVYAKVKQSLKARRILLAYSIVLYKELSGQNKNSCKSFVLNH